MPQRLKTQDFTMLQQKPSFPYYANDKIIGGLMIDLSFDLVRIQRTVYSFADLLQEIGGIAKALTIVAVFLMPLLQTITLEKFLISRIYKRQGKVYKSDKMPPVVTLEDALVALKRREPIKMSWTIPLYEWLKLYMVSWFKCCKFTENEWMYLKAKNRLAAELDITRLIKNLRTQNNLLKLISSPRELKLV